MKREVLFNSLNCGTIWDQWDCCVFDRKEAEEKALALRDSLAADLREAGVEVECFTLANQKQHRSIPGWRVELEADLYGLRYDAII